VVNRNDRKNIGPVMVHRINWELADTSSLNNDCNFIWKYSTKGVCYNKLTNLSEMNSMDKFKVYNIFEGHTEITNKRKLFINLKEYCDVK